MTILRWEGIIFIQFFDCHALRISMAHSGSSQRSRVFGSGLHGLGKAGSDLDLPVDALPGTTLFDLGGLQVSGHTGGFADARRFAAEVPGQRVGRGAPGMTRHRLPYDLDRLLKVVKRACVYVERLGEV